MQSYYAYYMIRLPNQLQWFLTQSRKKGTVVGVANGKFETLRDNEKSISCARPKPFHFLEWERKLSEIYELQA